MHLNELHFSVTKDKLAPVWQPQRGVNMQFIGATNSAYALQVARSMTRPNKAKPQDSPSVRSLYRTTSYSQAASRSAIPPAKSMTTSSTRSSLLASRSTSLSTIQRATASTGMRIARLALTLVGCPYVFGGESMRGFDCSGLAEYVYAKAGVAIPRTSYEQFQVGQAISRDQMEPGDLVFFATTDSGPSHVAVYVGNGLMVQALNPSTGVIVSHLDADYYRQRYIGARRPWHR
jgi:cell wall-associated NlpC family hydrolase